MKKRFTITQPISVKELFSTTDIDLGNRQLRNFQYLEDNRISRVALVANMVEYQPTEFNEYNIHKICSRIKAEEEVWNQVVDAIFDIDRIIQRDKQLYPLNRYIKDVFGIKIVVNEVSDAYRIQAVLEGLYWSDETLRQFHVEPRDDAHQLQFIEIKDYLANNKGSGWKALKSVFYWAGKAFEIQIQPLQNYMREREHLTKESHASFRIRRELVREQVAQKIPLFRFYRDLLSWLFLVPEYPAPTYKGVTVWLED